MSILDNKKKRDPKSSETEKEQALAQLQDLFLGSKAPKADFLANTRVTISPALLPKKEKPEVASTETSQNFGDPQLPLSFAKPKLKPSAPPKVEEPKIEPPAPPEPEPIEVKPSVTTKPLTSFDLLAVGTEPAAEKPTTVQKTKSFLAHFAKKDPKDSKDTK